MPQSDAERSSCFRQLKWSLQSLAMSGGEQPLLFPDYAPKPDDLAFEFDRCSSTVRDTYGADLTTAQLDALSAIHTKLATMSRDGADFDADLWTEAALASSEQWADVRVLASAALEAFGW